MNETRRFAAFYLEPAEGSVQDTLESRAHSAEVQILKITPGDIGGNASASGAWGGIPVMAIWYELDELGAFVIKYPPDLSLPLGDFRASCERLSPVAAFATSTPLTDTEIHTLLARHEKHVSEGNIEPLYDENFAALFLNRLDAELFDVESSADNRRWVEVENGLVVLGSG